MESVRENNIEQLSDWRNLKERGPETALPYLDALGVAFDDAPSAEKTAALQTALTEIEAEENNRLRYAAEAIGEQIVADRKALEDAQDAAAKAAYHPLPEQPDYPLSYTPQPANDNYPRVGAEQRISTPPTARPSAAA